jgi:hypothetical protein
VYDVRERTGNPTHASVDTVCERIFDRAAAPRTDLLDAYLDGTMATVVDRYGEAVVRKVIHRILVNGVPFRTAAADHDVAALDGVRIATQAPGELNTESQVYRFESPRPLDVPRPRETQSRWPSFAPEDSLRSSSVLPLVSLAGTPLTRTPRSWASSTHMSIHEEYRRLVRIGITSIADRPGGIDDQR